ncbi:membrane-bound PQQ-dependent dehydrogenase, glucose/quinate/shikimate family [Brevundimonas sp. NPDC092305]|uniref:membrane-bound PQQ-dependent dehydrogenase, glucose/quinate/shikimate family n=1 Tax=Brevundimonas sp. NPDC092305 TaxID=3363957 RepID=UPI00380751FF
MSIERKPKGLAGGLIVALGLLLLLIGIVLTGGGGWLISLGGSWYYLLAGIGLILSGVGLIRRTMLGAWIYIAVFLATLVWALWEVGIDGWGLLPRVVGPAVLLFLVLLTVPALTPGRGGKVVAGGGIAALVALLAVGGFASANAAKIGVTQDLPALQAIASSDPDAIPVGADWPAYGGSYHAQRYSPLTQITPANVGKLERVWAIHTGDLPGNRPGAQNKYASENTPLKVGDTLYACTGKGMVLALDPATGRQKWKHDPQVSDDAIPYTAACRGVSYYVVPNVAATEPCATRIIWGTLDARLIAVDARTGQRCAGFGQGGQVNTAEGMGPTVPGMISITSAPTIVRGVVVTGHQILDGQRRNAPSGVIKGFDAVTGQLSWAWDMMRPDINTTPPEGQIYTLGTPNMWTTASGDERMGLVYLPLGSTAADYVSADRTGPQLDYATSLVALDVTTGKPRWHFQTVRHDVWDYDLGSQATLVDFPTGGGSVPAVVLPSKQGDIYVLDRATGRPLTPVRDIAVPQGGVEPRMRTPTQPTSLYHTLRRDNDLDEKQMWGMSPIDQMICRIQYRQSSYKGFYTPPETSRRYIQYPGYNGGSDWGGIAVDPARGVIVANYNDMPNYNRLIPRAEADRMGWAPRGEPNARKGGAEGAGDPQAGAPYAISVNAGWRMPFTGLLCKEPPYGGIRAINMRTGKTIWDRPLGQALKNGPFGIPSNLPIEIGTPNNGGAVVTAGGLIFIAAATDDLIRAIDLKTGQTVWTAKLPGGGQTTPMIYEAGGRQFVVIAPGGHHFMETPVSDEVIAWALPQGA